MKQITIPLFYPFWLGLLIWFYMHNQISGYVFLLFLLKDINIKWIFKRKKKKSVPNSALYKGQYEW